MGGGSSKNDANNEEEKKEESISDENEENEEKEEKEEEEDNEESLENIKEEGEEEEEEEDDKKGRKIENKFNEDEKNKKRHKSKKVTNRIIKKKKEKKNNSFFSVEEEVSSSRKSEKNSTNKNINENNKLEEQKSFIDARIYNTNSTFKNSQNSKKSKNSKKKLNEKEKEKENIIINPNNNNNILNTNNSINENNIINNNNDINNINNSNNISNTNNSNNILNTNNSNNILNTNNSGYNESIYSNNNIEPYQRQMEYHNVRADNQVFGEFNYTNMDKINEVSEEKKSESSETKSDKELSLKEKINNEYQRHKNYLDTNEKGAYSEIHKKSYKNAKRYKYRKSLLLHQKEITCICSLSGKINKIAYATGSVEYSIKFWSPSFVNIYKINKLEWFPTSLCEFDTTNILSSESIYIKMYDLMSNYFECIHIFRDHIEDINTVLPLINFEENEFFFMSGGKDKILRLWSNDLESPIRYYEGHFDTVTHIQKIGGDNRKIISCSNDRTFIVWDIKNTNPIKIFNNYFNHLYLLGDNFGFCCGAYDNKIRFYDDEYLLSKCLVSELYGIRYILMIDDYCMLTVDNDNNMNILDTYDNNLLFKYTGYGDEVVSVIKSYNWEINNSENKIIITACKDGYIYLYSFESEIKHQKVTKNKKNTKKEKEIKAKSKSKEKDKTKIKKNKSKSKIKEK